MSNAFIFEFVRSAIMFFVMVTLAKNYFFLAMSPFYPVREKIRYIRHKIERRRKGL